ncbi:hypothetical protein BGZ63DRAFT_397831 [Mariannaea sp. PMI_226]|nr:hypothetical protein BGZ63DRAFT_397831 [Mariannaea sp. PMI_226]
MATERTPDSSTNPREEGKSHSLPMSWADFGHSGRGRGSSSFPCWWRFEDAAPLKPELMKAYVCNVLDQLADWPYDMYFHDFWISPTGEVHLIKPEEMLGFGDADCEYCRYFNRDDSLWRLVIAIVRYCSGRTYYCPIFCQAPCKHMVLDWPLPVDAFKCSYEIGDVLPRIKALDIVPRSQWRKKRDAARHAIQSKPKGPNVDFFDTLVGIHEQEIFEEQCS